MAVPCQKSQPFDTQNAYVTVVMEGMASSLRATIWAPKLVHAGQIVWLNYRQLNELYYVQKVM